jgi:hypothetical protein
MIDVWRWLQILTMPAMEASAIAKAKRRPRRPWPTKERVAVALELATAPGVSPTKAPRIEDIPTSCCRAELIPLKHGCYL